MQGKSTNANRREAVLPAASVESHAAVDVDRLPCHCGRLLRAKEQSSARDFVCGLRTALQQTIQKARQLLFRADAHFLCQDRAELLRHLRFRSEERRVGKESSCPCCAHNHKIKSQRTDN